MSDSSLVLDNSVLSAIFGSGWFHLPSFYTPDQQVLIPRQLWEQEFIPFHDLDSAPHWATIQEADLTSVKTKALGQLSKYDWSCIALAEQNNGDPLILTNDRTLREVANRRDLCVEWGTNFVLRTFKACGITTEEFKDGVETYLGDVTLPENVKEDVRSTEK